MTPTGKKQALPMVSASMLIERAVRQEIAQVISDNQGKEVFFIGKLNEAGKVCEIEAHAFGSKEAVPALVQLARPGDVVIHNHPAEEELEPSGADINIASQLASEDVASYIVDNDCKKLRVIVKPIKKKEVVVLQPDQISGFFQPGGKIAQRLEGYEHRPQQLEMTRAVTEAFNKNLIAIIEAGTGVGKSLAYLLPAVIWSIKNKERVVVSTNTINLQEQLINKDLPLLREKAGLDFTSVLMKGRKNYVCRRKLAFLQQEPLAIEVEEKKQQIKDIMKWARQTEDGSLSDLNFAPAEEAWELFSCEPETCLRIRCQHYETCFFYRARRQAARANVIITNHHLIMADMALRQATGNYNSGAVLPAFNRLIFDEAHNLEEVAASYFGFKISYLGIAKLLGYLVRKKKRDAGLLPLLGKRIFALRHAEPEKLLNQLLSELKDGLILERFAVDERIKSQFDELIKIYLEFMQRDEFRQREELSLRISGEITATDFWKNGIEPAIKAISGELIQYCGRMKRFAKSVSSLSSEAQTQLSDYLLEFRGRIDKLEELIGKLNFFYHPVKEEEDNFCRWLEYEEPESRRGQLFRICAAPINIAQYMQDTVYRINKTVIMTSATLAVADEFNYFREQVGLNTGDSYDWELMQHDADAVIPSPREKKEGLKIIEVKLDAPFDYDEQALVAIPVDLPEPNDEAFAKEIAKFLFRSLVISQGRAFVLFTSYKLLNEVYEKISSTLESMGYQCLRQGDQSRHRLLEQFKKDFSSVLFATSSFWEGVDVKGEALQCLILTRLPFRVPTDPLPQAKAEQLKKQGRDPFIELEVPYAVIKFKQGFGRLIRSREDKGVVLILDRRVVTRHYGKAFIKSLPSQKALQAESEEVLDQMKQFFAS